MQWSVSLDALMAFSMMWSGKVLLRASLSIVFCGRLVEEEHSAYC